MKWNRAGCKRIKCNWSRNIYAEDLRLIREMDDMYPAVYQMHLQQYVQIQVAYFVPPQIFCITILCTHTRSFLLEIFLRSALITSQRCWINYGWGRFQKFGRFYISGQPEIPNLNTNSTTKYGKIISKLIKAEITGINDGFDDYVVNTFHAFHLY